MGEKKNQSIQMHSLIHSDQQKIPFADSKRKLNQFDWVKCNKVHLHCYKIKVEEIIYYSTTESLIPIFKQQRKQERFQDCLIPGLTITASFLQCVKVNDSVVGFI